MGLVHIKIFNCELGPGFKQIKDINQGKYFNILKVTIVMSTDFLPELQLLLRQRE